VRVDIETIDRRRPRFKRWGQPEQGELREGRVAVGPLEIVRLDNDAAAPENGTIEFLLEGGR
jgi:hypothetical protein